MTHLSNTTLDGRLRPVIEQLHPSLNGGVYPVKRVPGERVHVSGVIVSDGHDRLRARLLYRRSGETTWRENPFEHEGNDLWYGSFVPEEVGSYEFTVIAWVDHFFSWLDGLEKKLQAGQNLTVDLMVGGRIMERASSLAPGDDSVLLNTLAREISGETGSVSQELRAKKALSDEVEILMERYNDRSLASAYRNPLLVTVEPPRARFSAWYEMFPRSATGTGRHGTFRDCIDHLSRVASMGFDVLYFPPIHPVGTTFRKGKNNSLVAGPDDPGSPWAIGSSEGGFKSILPALGTPEDFRELVREARKYDIDIALDIAFQCSPDHPYVKEHPEWFLTRPDGSVQYAENPPKKYQDIYPFHFETESWRDLWEELKSVFLHWIGEGVTIFRVDNPHTKPFAFWEWCIKEIKREHPNVIFLAEAFTRPHLMYHLAKIGFTQSYTYFTWRNTKEDFTRYMQELLYTDVSEYFRPNFWPNTPDILPEHLQTGGRAAFMSRLVLAATLSSNYGIYGPAFELMECKPREEGSEEYLDSEKYEIKRWNIERPDSLSAFISRVNFIRRDNEALHSNHNFLFHHVDNEKILVYSKRSDDYSNVVVVCVNLDYRWKQTGFVELLLHELGVDSGCPYRMNDLLNGTEYVWNGGRNYIELDPGVVPVHIFRLEQ